MPSEPAVQPVGQLYIGSVLPVGQQQPLFKLDKHSSLELHMDMEIPNAGDAIMHATAGTPTMHSFDMFFIFRLPCFLLNKKPPEFGGREVRKIIDVNDLAVFGHALLYNCDNPTYVGNQWSNAIVITTQMRRTPKGFSKSRIHTREFNVYYTAQPKDRQEKTGILPVFI